MLSLSEENNTTNTVL